MPAAFTATRISPVAGIGIAISVCVSLSPIPEILIALMVAIVGHLACRDQDRRGPEFDWTQYLKKDAGLKGKSSLTLRAVVRSQSHLPCLGDVPRSAFQASLRRSRWTGRG